MSTSIQSKIFHLSAYSVAAAASFYDWSSGETSVSSSLVRGAQLFAIASVFDRAVKYVLARHAKPENITPTTTLFAPFAEECMYSGVLLTQSIAWMIPRLAVAFFTGITAARSLTGRVTAEQNKQGFTPDTKIGFLWALSRELLLWTLPSPLLPSALIAADSCVFALAEVCPKTGHPEVPKFSREWSYKVLSSAFFRATANVAALTHGMVASIGEHLLFNISHALGKTAVPATEKLLKGNHEITTHRTWHLGTTRG
jgi:hypothetical protein